MSLLLRKIFGICWANRAFRTVFFLRDLGAITFFEYTHPNVNALLIRTFTGLKIIDNE